MNFVVGTTNIHRQGQTTLKGGTKPESKAVTTNMTQKESVCLQNVVLKIIGHQ